VISVGRFPVSRVPSYIPQPLPDASFLVPVEISGAVNLQNWGFDLLFDDSVVTQVQPDPFGGDVGVYGAEFVPGDSNSLSFLLSGGFLLPGDLSGVAGSYPTPPYLLSGVSGSGVLAFVLFECVDVENCNSPNFSIANPSVQESVPEPATAKQPKAIGSARAVLRIQRPPVVADPIGRLVVSSGDCETLNKRHDA